MKLRKKFKVIFLFSLIFFITNRNIFPLEFSKEKVFNQVNIFIANGHIEQAKKQLLDLIKIRYKISTCYILVGDILLTENNFTKARQYYKKALNCTSSEKNRAIIFNKISDTYIKKYEKNLAIDILKEAILEGCFNYQTYLQLATIYEELDLPDNAFVTYEEAYKLNHYNEYINLHLGLLSEARLNYEDAIKFYQEALCLKNNDQIALQKLAFLYFKTNNIDKAYAILLNVDESMVTSEYYMLLGDIYYSKNFFSRAVEQYRKVLKKSLSIQEIQKAYLYLYLSFLKMQDYQDLYLLKLEINNKFNNDKFFTDILSKTEEIISTLNQL